MNEDGDAFVGYWQISKFLSNELMADQTAGYTHWLARWVLRMAIEGKTARN
jgi:hypothetical protein